MMLRLLIALLMFSVSKIHACENSLIVVHNGDWIPYMYKLPDGSFAGQDFQLLQNTLEQIGCELGVQTMRKRRADIESKKGTFDFYLGASYTEQRNRTFYFSAPYRAETVGYMLNTNSRFAQSKDLQSIMDQGAVVAINMDGYFGDLIESYKRDYPEQFVHEFRFLTRLQMLDKGDVDVVVEDRTVLCQLLRTEADKQHLVAKQILHQDDIHFMLNRKTVDASFVVKFNRSLERVLSATQMQNSPSC